MRQLLPGGAEHRAGGDLHKLVVGRQRPPERRAEHLADPAEVGGGGLAVYLGLDGGGLAVAGLGNVEFVIGMDVLAIVEFEQAVRIVEHLLLQLENVVLDDLDYPRGGIDFNGNIVGAE